MLSGEFATGICGNDMLKAVILERQFKSGFPAGRKDAAVRRYRKILKESGIKWIETFGDVKEIAPEFELPYINERYLLNGFVVNVTVFRSVE